MKKGKGKKDIARLQLVSYSGQTEQRKNRIIGVERIKVRKQIRNDLSFRIVKESKYQYRDRINKIQYGPA